MRTLLLTFIAALFMALPAQAENFTLYAMPYGGFANLSEPTMENVTYGVEAGITNDRWDIGGDVMKWSHLDDESTVVQAKVRYAFGSWFIQPVAAIGGGIVVEGVDPVLSLEGGLLWTANDEGEAGSFGIALTYTQLFLFDDISDIGDFGSWADRTDNQVLLKAKLTF